MMTDITGMTHKIVKIFAVSLALIFVVVFLTASMPQSTAQTSPQVLAQAIANPISTGQPIISENTNITWSSFNQPMAPNEYLNGTGHPEYINAEPSVFYPNYISINPANIIAKGSLQNNRLGKGTDWGNISQWGVISTPANSTQTVEYANQSGSTMIKMAEDVTGATGGSGQLEYIIPTQNYSSQSLAYDYLTGIYTFNAPADSGALGYITLWNSTGHGTGMGSTTQGTYYLSESLEQIQKNDGYSTTFNTTAGSGYSQYLKIDLTIGMASGSPTGEYSITLNALALTTYPITFGSNATGTTPTQSQGNLRLAKFHPENIDNVSIVDNGYSEALSMPTQMSENYTETQNQIAGSNYIEEETLQGNLLYPTGTDISYSASNISLQYNGISGSQIPLLNVNGVSYSTQISNVNGNSTALVTTNPNQPTSIIYQVEYTATQWNSFTAPPFFLSIQGIEYYWWVGLIAIFGGLGVFAGLRSYATGKEENLRAPPKVR